MTAEQVVQKLKKNKLKISTAESCTGGLLAEMITRISGASEVFECGFVVYSNRIKNKILGVKQETIDKYTVYSTQVAEELALSCTKLSDSDIGVGITGLAGPGGGTPDLPVGTVFVSLYTKYNNSFITKKLFFDKDRIRIRTAVVDTIFDILNELLP